MSSNEEYLDNLLKSMSDNSNDGGIMSSEEIEAMFAAAEAAAQAIDKEEEEEKQTPVIEETAEEIETSVLEKPAEKFPEAAYKETDAKEVSESAYEEDELSRMLNELTAEDEEPQTFETSVEELLSADAKPTVESTRNLSQEEIEQLLAASNPGTPEPAKEEEQLIDEGDALEDDLMALLGSLQDDGDLGEINDLLEKAENNEAVDESVFDATKEEPVILDLEEAAAGETADAGEDIPESENIKKSKKKKEKKDKKEKEKKPGLFSKLFTSLTEEEVSAQEINENQAIINALEAEDIQEAGKKKKLKKGKMPAAGKKGKGNAKNEEDDIEDIREIKDKKGKPQKEKPKKEKKPRKEKPKKEVIPEKPGRRISKKSIFVVVLFSATVMAVVLLAVHFLSGTIRKREAVDAFQRQDYMSCYEAMYGMELSDEEQEMFRHAEIVLRTERRLDVYERFLNEDKELEALDSLMQAIVSYKEVYGRAQECGAAAEIDGLYDKIRKILSDNYGLSEQDARAIAFCDNNVEYTRYLTALTEGKRISGESGEGDIILPKEELEDVLPAEEELIKPEFKD